MRAEKCKSGGKGKTGYQLSTRPRHLVTAELSSQWGKHEEERTWRRIWFRTSSVLVNKAIHQGVRKGKEFLPQLG